MVNTNAFELSRKIGYESYGELGRNAFEELELCFASKIAPKFAQTLKLRSYVNLSFYWARSFFKNTMIEEFEECLLSSFPTSKITSGTLETMFGSMNTFGTKIIPPLFWGYELCFIPELLAFLSTGDFKDKANVFNEVLEGQKTTRNLLKFGNAEQTLIDEYKNGVNGLYFDGRTLSYEPKTCFVVGTRPLDNKTYTYLEQSGFWSRFHTIQFRITDTAARDIFTGALYPADVNIPELKAQLKTLNESLFAKKHGFSKEIPNYDELLLPILQKADEVATKISKSVHLDLATIMNVRIKGDIIREVNAYRILCPEKTDEDIIKWTMDRLPHFFDFVVNPIIAPSQTVVKQKTLDGCLREIFQLTKGQLRKRSEIQEVLQKQGYSRATIDRALMHINKKGLNKSEEYGVYET